MDKFIVWDWNGTLQDDLPISLAVVNQNMRTLGRPPVDADTYRDCFDVPISRMYKNLGVSDNELSRFLDRMQDEYLRIYDDMVASAGFKKGAVEAIDFASAHGVSHVVLSNHLKDAVLKDLTRLKKLEAFRDVLAWPDQKTQFSHSKGIFLASYMMQHSLSGKNGMIVGDTEEEVRISRSLGLVSVAVMDGYSSRAVLEKAKPDYLIEDLTELKPILRQRGFAA
ncbi:MAG: HAD hydrolase-like protein [Alphaproteobacteria bacterium]|nr:HAD hydrolase-like protein [Alphaproteobacteria bacterium]